MVLPDKPELTPEERRLPIAKYYDRPFHLPGPLEQQILSQPLNPEKVIPPERFTDLLQLEGYTGGDYGYSLLPDGSGYVATYSVFRNATFEMLDWWFQWMTVHPKHQPDGVGNLRYKVWCPYGHFDHGLYSKPDGTQVLCALEALDFGLDGDPVDKIYMHALDPSEFGVSKERLAILDAAGALYGISYETFGYPGMHLCAHIMRRREDGVIENIGREWMGYGVKDNKIIRVKETPVDEVFLKKVALHCTAEMIHLDDILPEIYEEYHDQPIDAD